MTALWSFLSASYIPLVFVLLNLSGRGILSVAEAFGTQTYNEITGPQGTSPGTGLSASTFFLIMGCLGLLVFLAMNRLVKWVEESNLLILSFLSMGIGFGVITDFQDQSAPIASAFPLRRCSSSSLTSTSAACTLSCALCVGTSTSTTSVRG